MSVEAIVKPAFDLDSSYCWLANHPLILYHSIPGEEFHANLPPERVYRMCSQAWMHTPDELVSYYHRDRAARPQDVLTMLPNEAVVHRELVRRGVPSVHVNHNALLDERVYRIMPEVSIRYDAVYTARMSYFKRHGLARDVHRLLVIGGVQTYYDDPTYFADVQRSLPHAHFTHDERNQPLNADDVARRLNSARVGLCLSPFEGAMYASVEYLLCGRPVVSTFNVGGRNEFLDLRYCRMVPDEPEAVAVAVRELGALRLPPEWIREQTLIRLAQQRRRFIGLVQGFFDRERFDRDYHADFAARFFNKMCHWRLGRDVRTHLVTDCARPSIPPGVQAPLVEAAAPAMPRTWPNPTTLGIVGPRWEDVWRSVQYALFVRRSTGVRVKLCPRWLGLPGRHSTPVSHQDCAALVRAMLDVLGASGDLETADVDPEEVTWPNNVCPWHLPYLPTCDSHTQLIDTAPADGAWHFPHSPTVMRWRGWSAGPPRRVAVDPENTPAGSQSLSAALPDVAWVALDERQPAKCVEALRESDLFIGGINGLIQLAYSVGVPVFLVETKPAGYGLQPLHGDRPAIWCSDVAGLARKVRGFLGLQ